MAEPLPRRFGCAACFGDDPATAYEHRLGITDRLIDDSHFMVLLRRCPACAQAFVTIFTEFIDWSGGDDPQYRDIMPITADEAARMRTMGEDLDLEWLETIGRNRRRLCMNHPKDGPRQVFWSDGGLRICRSAG